MSLPELKQAGAGYFFLDVTLDVSAERLVRASAEIKLRPKSFQVLRYLADHAGVLVTREELLAAIWPDVIVTDESLTKCIADIRKALGDDAQQLIRTVARRGYVFTPRVSRVVGFPRHAEAESSLATTRMLSDHASPAATPYPSTAPANSSGSHQYSTGALAVTLVALLVWPARSVS